MKIIFFLIFFLFSNHLMFSQIYDIKSFLDQCPTNDPVIDIILKDFEIRHNGELITNFPCYEPVSTMNPIDYSNPLIYLQTLRTIYYMDWNRPKYLPWTDTSLYVWMKNRIGGINIEDGVSGGYCCTMIDGKKFFVTGVQDDFSREYDKKWIGISGNIDFFAHEIRHTDANGYGHSSCCGITYGCDDDYNENDLSPYGIQYWLNKSWLTGFINVGARTSYNEADINEIINSQLFSVNTLYRSRFCNSIPASINLNDIILPLGSGNLPTLTVPPKNRNLGPEPGSAIFNISSNTTWTVTDNSSWLTVSPASGSGNKKMTASVTANNSTEFRVGTITISGNGVSSQSVTVTQFGNGYDQSLIAHYPLLSNAHDIIGNYPDMTLINTPFRNGGIYCNGIYGFPGGPKDFSNAYTPEIGQISYDRLTFYIEFLIEQYTSYDNPVMVAGAGTSGRWLGFAILTNGKFSLRGDNFEEVAVGSTVCTLNQWHSAAITYNSFTNSGKLYIDEALVCEGTFTFNHQYAHKSIGIVNYSSGFTYLGYLRNVKIYNDIVLISTETKDILTSGINVFPNPVTKLLSIEYKNENANIKTIRLLDSQGKLLLTEKVSLSIQHIDFSKYDSGFYILEFIKSSGESQHFKILKY